MKINKIHTDGYYEAKQSRAGKKIFFSSCSCAIFILLKDDIAYASGLTDMKIISYIVLAVFSGLFLISSVNYFRIRSLRKENRRISEELIHYGMKIPCVISLIEKKGVLEEYIIHITGTDGYGKSHDFCSDPLYKNPGDYVSAGDELNVYIDRENRDIYYIQYPDTFPVDAARFYVY